MRVYVLLCKIHGSVVDGEIYVYTDEEKAVDHGIRWIDSGSDDSGENYEILNAEMKE